MSLCTPRSQNRCVVVDGLRVDHRERTLHVFSYDIILQSSSSGRGTSSAIIVIFRMH
jgi:hypothetical protein